MNNLNVYSVSAINTLQAEYTDPSLIYKQYRANYEQGFALTRINALSGAVDTTINNYTSQYLTNKKHLTDIFEIEEKPIRLATITTPLIFNTLFNTDNQKYLYIYKNSDSGTADITTCRVLLTSFVGFENNIYFELEVLNNNFLRVKHNNGRKDYFLNVISDTEFPFISYQSDTVSLTAERNDIFRYYLDSDGYLLLFKNTQAGMKIVTLSGDRLTLQPLITGTSYKSNDNLIKINYNFLDIAPKLNSSWISYNVDKQNDLLFNFEKCQSDINSQYLLHTSYNTLSDSVLMNYITLNNFKSEKNYVKRGSTMLSGSSYLPETDFRDYTSLQTGNNQERGNDNINLTYVWYDKDIKARNGTDTYFTTPSSIYPYEKLNINDTKFVQNGALGGKTPTLSDKIFCLKRSDIDYGNGRYLCTWLSGGTWVDRYYYPDLLLREQALSSYPVYTPTFDNNIDQYNIVDKASIAAIAFFDKKSDLCIEPSTRYYYSRVSEEEINKFVETTTPTASGFTDYYDVKNNLQQIDSKTLMYDGTKYNRYSIIDTINSNHSFTISFDVIIDPGKKYGYEILGNLTDKGFGVLNDEQITPFVYLTQDNSLYVYNTDMVQINYINFDKKIIDVIRNKNLDEYFVVCGDASGGGYIYKVNTLGIVVKQEILPEIIGYINYYQNENSIYFLMNTSGTTYQVNKNNLESILIQVNLHPRFDYFTSSVEAIAEYNGVLYGIPGQEVKYIDNESVYYMKNNETIVKINLKTGKLDQFLSSASKNIIDFTVDSNGNLVVVYNINKIVVLDKARNILQQSDYSGLIGAGSSFVNVDVVRQYTLNGLEEFYIYTYLDANNNLFSINSKIPEPVNIGLKGKPNNYFYYVPYQVRNKSFLTNFNLYNQFDNSNGLNFKLTLTNYLSSEDIVTKQIKFNYSNLDKGAHTFTYRFDSLQGNISLFVDGELYQNLTVQPGKYQLQNIFADDIFVGSTGFYNGVDLATYLNQTGYYFINELSVRNLLIYNRALLDSEITALNLYGEQINDIVLSVPASQRNNLEEIERYFKFEPVTSSKKVNIYIKNANINNIDLKNNIKNLVLSEVSKYIPVGVSINDVEFVDFK